MNFKFENDGNNVKIELLENEEVKWKTTCFLDNISIENGQKEGCIGDIEVSGLEYGIEILKKCEEVFLKKDIHRIVGPMNGNTWKKYRTQKFSNGEPLFLLENVNPESDNEVFLKSGFYEVHTYTTNKGTVEDAYDSEILDIAETEIKSEGIEIRKFSKDNYLEDLKKIYNVSSKSFRKNPYYTPIYEPEFIGQYEPYIQMIDDIFVLIAEKKKFVLYFVFQILMK